MCDKVLIFFFQMRVVEEVSKVIVESLC